MLTVGDQFPDFSLKAVVANDLQNAFTDIDQNSFQGKWKVYFFYPKDFTFICPTEMIEFDKLNDAFKAKNAQLIGGSIDSEFVHMAWRNDHPGLKNLSYPLLADIKRELSSNLGILDKNEGVTLRATFIVDPENVIQHVSVNALSVGRNADEVLRLLEAFQTEELVPCNWQPGEDVLKVG